ncbi:WhiB family transcriptional regulator [Hoyosella altamirensis]|uniref:WhiB family redox-sensing transcriptional regulator n=1 Tax=Hoyosella altamirensis TaxID=616997 RepID=A0A839RPQ1_9ACTN|nr:WhiB family transcriptional regulator [Hoyosella altamirensis]MBB3038982.1 WhiB family redox-sensing transcriptional regulator [Hoyosella altamirensis]
MRLWRGTGKQPPKPDLPAVLANLIDRRLTDARCAGKAPLFDSLIDDEPEPQRRARLQWAASECSTCPVLAACDQVASELPDGEKTGIWAGRNYERPPGRPKTEPAA